MHFSSEFWAAIIGAIVGGFISIFGQWLYYCWTTSSQRKLENARKDMLKKLLDNAGSEGWRSMGTLSGVIGASKEETARLLIEIGARSSETESDVWAYLKDKPLQ